MLFQIPLHCVPTQTCAWQALFLCACAEMDEIQHPEREFSLFLEAPLNAGTQTWL